MSSNARDQLINFGVELDKCCTLPKLDAKIAALNLDCQTQIVVVEYAEVLSMSDAEFAQTQKLRAKLRGFLCSLLMKK